MPNSHEFVLTVNELLARLEESGELRDGIQVANAVIRLLGTNNVNAADTVIDERVLQLPNAERYDHWFQNHPWMGGERAAFDITDAKDMPLQAKFYWLKKRSRQFIAGGVHFTENWEDADYTRNAGFKIGIDFFLAPNAKSLLLVLSNRGNLRVVELQHRLNNTQIDIFAKWHDARQISSIEALHTTLWESFKLQSVNKDFYTGVSNSFIELLQHLKSKGRDQEDAKLFASRLLGRLLFIWFLRKKNLINESLGYFDTADRSATSYYHGSLEQLFFKTLNVPVDERDELKKEQQKQLFPEETSHPQAKLFQVDHKTPYLNGGLFEAHHNDWYQDLELTFPEGFFTNLYEHFAQFNFTTDESTPEYEQVAIDPEMLGRVFESLLATQLEESGEQARKAKGAFYTPREIVGYMCREALRNYLYGSSTVTDDRFKQSVNDLLDRSDHEWAGAGTNSLRDAVPKEYRATILDALDTVTILDPACGSGAFPMGMLQLLIRTYERLESRFDPYKTKLQIVQNNVFGLDIEPMAVEISRLRAWLSLIVDEENPQAVAPLPNLDFKFVCANSLIPLEDSKNDIFNNPELHEKLAAIRKEYFNARLPHTKKAAQTKYYKLINSNVGLFDNLRTRQLKSFDPFKNSHPAEFFDADQMFGLPDGFDIVIGNPPYVRADSPSFKKQRASILGSGYYETLYEKWDLFVPFIEKGLRLLAARGNLSYITSNSLFTSKFATRILDFIQDEYYTNYIDYFDDKTKVFDAGVVPVIFSISRSQVLGDVRKVAHSGKFGNISKIEQLNISDFKKMGAAAFRASKNSLDIAVKTVPLGDICYMSKGMVLNSDEKKAKGEFKKNDLISKEASDSHPKIYIEGKDIDRYRVKKNHRFLEWNTGRVPSQLSRPTFPELYEVAKLMRGRVTGGVYDNSGIVCNDSIILFARFADLAKVENKSVSSSIKKNNSTDRHTLETISQGFDLRYVLAIINSKFAYYFLNGIRRHRLKNYFYPDDFRKLPIASATAADQQKLADYVIKASDPSIDDAERSAVITALDREVYALYELSDSDATQIEKDFTG